MTSADFFFDAFHHVGVHAKVALLIVCCALGNQLLMRLRGSIHAFDLRVLSLLMSALILMACVSILGEELSGCIHLLSEKASASSATSSARTGASPRAAEELPEAAAERTDASRTDSGGASGADV